MFNWKLVLGACTITLIASQAIAQSVPGAETPPVTVGVTSTYYSNIANSSTAIASLRGLKRADVVYAPTIDLNLFEPAGGLSLFLAGQAGYDFHQRNSILDRERINLQGGAHAHLSACETTIEGSFARYQSSLADLSVVTTKNTEELITEELDAVCDQSGRIVPSMSFSHTEADNSAVLYKSSDYNSNAVTANLLYKAGSLGEVSLIGQYTQTNYPNRILGAAAGSDGYDLYSGGVHYGRTIGSKIDIGVSVSETSLSTHNGIGAGFSGITYDATVAYRPTSRLNFSVEASRKTVPASYLNAAYATVESYSANVDYRLSSRLKANLGAVQTHSSYEGAALVPGTDLTAQTYRSFFGTLDYNLSPTFSVSLTAGQDQRHADVIGYSYSGARVGLSVSKAFGP